MIRNVTCRHCVIALTLFMGLFSQFQTVFACEFKDSEFQLVCCCENSGEISKDCAVGDHCADRHARSISDNTACCNLSYQPVPGATAISSTQQIQQVLLLDATQPPPILTSFELQTIPASNQVVRFTTDTPPLGAGIQTYLLTQRLRI